MRYCHCLRCEFKVPGLEEQEGIRFDTDGLLGSVHSVRLKAGIAGRMFERYDALRRVHPDNTMQERLFSDAQVQKALDKPVTAVLATINPNGSPLATPMWYVHDERGIGMVSVDGLQKVRNLRRDPRVSMVVETGAHTGVQCIIVQGTVEFLDAPRDRAALGAAFVDKYGESVEQRWNGRTVPPDRVLFRIHPQRVKLWG